MMYVALLSSPIISIESIASTSIRVIVYQPTDSLSATRYRLGAERLTGPHQPKCSTVASQVQGITTENIPLFLTQLEEYSIYKLLVSAQFGAYQSVVDNYTFFSTQPAGTSLTKVVLFTILAWTRNSLFGLDKIKKWICQTVSCESKLLLEQT